MNEIYWITRLDSIGLWLCIISVVSGAFAVCSLIPYFVKRDDYVGEREEKDKSWMDFWEKVVKRSTIVFFIFMPLSVLVPTTKEAMLIWGVGTTIDYVKNNETIQQLPDKCVEALDAWVESLNEDSKEETK